MASNTILLSAGLAGVASHVLYFNRYEQHMYGIHLLVAFIASFATLVGTLHNAYSLSIIQALTTTALLSTSYLAGTYGSTLIYRLFLNPLNRFPGPYPAKIGGLWWSSTLGQGNAYLKLADLHKKYGRFVRITPNELSITHPDAVEMALGQGSKVTKAPWYDMENPYSSMHTCRDKALHDRRRKVWAPAFSDKMLREYEKLIHHFNDQFIAQFTKMQGKSVDATKWFGLFSFDVMGSLAFGKEYGMVASGAMTHELELMMEGMEPLGHMLPTWLMRMLMFIPGMLPGYEKFLAFCDSQLKERVHMKPERQDILTRILEAYVGIANPEREAKLRADTRLIIVAGADTTAVTLTFLFYYLAQNPDIVEKLRQEVTPLTRGNWTDKDIQNAEILNGAIKEALRLFPPVPSGVRRMCPPGGLIIGDTFVPAGTEFLIPGYVLGRDPEVYEDPLKFIPERWSSKSHMVKHKGAWFPFSLGPFGCIGKNLALMELRTLTTNIVLRWNVKLAPGEDGHRILNQTKDHFTSTPGQLDLVFTPV